MRYIFLLFLLQQFTVANEINTDVPEFLEKVSRITKGRWDVSIDPAGLILIRTKEAVAGKITGDFSVLDRDRHSLEFKFKIVNKPKEQKLEQKSKELIELRKQAIEIDHFFNKGHYWYRPEEKEEWALVLKIKKLEREIRNIPEYRYKSVYFSNEDPWWFYPNSKDDKAIQYSKDILEIYNLLEKTKKMN